MKHAYLILAHNPLELMRHSLPSLGIARGEDSIRPECSGCSPSSLRHTKGLIDNSEGLSKVRRKVRLGVVDSGWSPTALGDSRYPRA